MTESFFPKTAKFEPNLLKSSTGKINLINLRQEIEKNNATAQNSFGSTLRQTISQSEDTKLNKKQIDLESIHRVKSGETLSHIALKSMKKAGLEIDSKKIMQIAFKLAEFNNIKNPNLIIPGQKIDLSIIQSKNATLEKNYQSFATKYFPVNEEKSKLNSTEVLNQNLQSNTATNSKKNDSTSSQVSAINTDNKFAKSNNPLLNKTLNRAIDLGYISDKEATQAKEKIYSMASIYKFTPDDFARVALMESDGFNPKATNGSCFGIIQFCDGEGRGAASVGLSHDPEKILELNVPDQLDLVSQYFEDTDLRKFKPASLDQLYLTILSPAAREVFNVNEPLSIPGPQARALHVGGVVDAPITKASIVKGLISHAKNTLSNHLFSKTNSPVALNLNTKYKAE